MATTAANGQYRLDNVPAGWQTVQAVKAGMVAGAMVAVARPPVDREARGFAVNGEPPAGRGLAGLPDRANRTARSLLARPAETGQAVAETRVFVTPDETVTAPDLLLAPEGAANNDSVALVRLNPAPSKLGVPTGSHRLLRPRWGAARVQPAAPYTPASGALTHLTVRPACPDAYFSQSPLTSQLSDKRLVREGAIYQVIKVAG